MQIVNNNTFGNAYAGYLEWFHEKSRPQARPKDQEEILSFQIGNEDIFENDKLAVNRLYYFVPLYPSESKSGKLELYVMSEMNLLMKTGGDISEIVPIEYERNLT